jgi:thiol-disulfide isomerase/thioredoxin
VTRRAPAVWPVALGAVLLTACTLGAPESGLPGGAISIETVPLIAAGDRDPAPAVCGQVVTGGAAAGGAAAEEEICLADFAGTPVLVNFWASWCGPCAREIPELVDVAAAYEGRLQVLGVNVQDSRTNARSFERDQGVDYPSLFDPGATIASRFEGIAPQALPSTILVDAEQQVAVRLFGAVSRDQLEPYLAELT